MSYDLYCYPSKSGVPNSAEAQAFVEAVGAAEESGLAIETSSRAKERVTAALVEHNPRLEPFNFDYGEIAKFQKISEDEARALYRHVELNPPDGDLAIQLTVFDDHVAISVPYWYEGSKADQVFSQLSGYLRVIANASDFLAYDPQTGMAFDPRHTELLDHQHYDKVLQDMPKIVARAKREIAEQSTEQPKPWWKFW